MTQACKQEGSLLDRAMEKNNNEQIKQIISRRANIEEKKT